MKKIFIFIGTILLYMIGCAVILIIGLVYFFPIMDNPDNSKLQYEKDVSNKKYDSSLVFIRKIDNSIKTYEEKNKSFEGFQIPKEVTFPECSQSPIINVSPDGKNMAIFVKSCKDSTNTITEKMSGDYFCLDALSGDWMNKDWIRKTGRVGVTMISVKNINEVYAKSGKYICPKN
ncbi:MAG: hypothetical protein NTZ13_01090 [Candidatus Parcubacteria bacterium]|nr:hypothetical protein [Candidatus Parcubacteria bacterium]